MEDSANKSYMDQKPLILNELTQAKELLKHLESQLDAASTNGKLLIPQILSIFDNSLFRLSGIKSEASNQSQLIGCDMGVIPADSPISVNEIPQCDYESDLIRSSSRKRKTLPRWTEQVRVCEQTGLEGPVDDGYSWRKYGQKDILEGIYPRSYYRCTHRKAQGCFAVKQVQRSDEDPSMFDVTYCGRHTCIQAAHSLPGQSQSNPDQQDEKRHKKTQETIISFATSCHVKKKDSGTPQVVQRSPSFSFESFPSASTPIPCIAKESDNNNIFSSMTPDNDFMNIPFSSSFISSTTSETNSFSPCRMNNFEGGQSLQTLEYDDLCEFTSAVTSELDSQDLYLDFDFFDGYYESNFTFLI